MSLIGFCFGIGTVSADFQEGGKRLSAKEQLIISVTVSERRSGPNDNITVKPLFNWGLFLSVQRAFQ